MEKQTYTKQIKTHMKTHTKSYKHICATYGGKELTQHIQPHINNKSYAQLQNTQTHLKKTAYEQHTTLYKI